MPATKYEADATYTDQEIANCYRQLIARGAVAGEEYSIGERRLRFPGMTVALQVLEKFEQRAAASEGPVSNLVRLNRR